MTTGQPQTVLRHLRRLVLRDDAGPADGELLEEFVARRDEAAFEALLRRHGPMVLGVCRRVLANQADAEDAFQATFLVLVRKAASIVPRAMVGNWLYGVAHNTALKAKAMKGKRRAMERRAAAKAGPAREDDRQLQECLDRELSRLPEKYRVPVVLCELEGKSLKEAARQLNWPQGTVASRLARARALLAKRLSGQDPTLPVGALALVLSQAVARAQVPAPLTASTIQAASSFAAGGAVSATVAALTEGVLKAMLLTKLKGTLAGLILVVVVFLGGGYLLPTRAADKGKELIIPIKMEGEKKEADEAFNKEILATEAKYWEAAMKFDADAMAKLYADDFVAFSERGRSEKAVNVEMTKRLRNGNIKFRNVEVIRLNKDAAVITYRMDSDVFDRAGGVVVRYRDTRMSNTWVRRDGRWVLVFCQMTQMPHDARRAG
jgi:RNA polymerase sigma factor (sigma-70 family)